MMYLGKDDENDVKVRDVEPSGEKMTNTVMGLFGLTMFAMVFGFMWMIATGVFYFLAIERILELMNFDWSIWLLVVVAFVSFMLIGTIGNIIGIRFTEGIAVFGLLSVMPMFEGTSMYALVAICVVSMMVFTGVVMVFNYAHRKSMNDFTGVFRRK